MEKGRFNPGSQSNLLDDQELQGSLNEVSNLILKIEKNDPISPEEYLNLENQIDYPTGLAEIAESIIQESSLNLELFKNHHHHQKNMRILFQ